MHIQKLIGPLVGLVFALISCGDATPVKNTVDTSAVDSAQITSDIQYLGKDSEVVLLAPEAYDSGFVNALLRSNLAKKYILDHDAMTVDGEKITFRNDLKLNQVYELKGKAGEKSYTLIVKRVSNSTLTYKLEESKMGQSLASDEGKASLAPAFFIGSELDEDDEGNTYPADVYSHEGDCMLDIRIGLDEKGAVSAKLIRQCNDESANIDLEDSPLLTE